MTRVVFHFGARAGLVVILAFILAATTAAQEEKVLHNFTSVPDGADPQAGLIFDTVGNLYGTTWGGGANGPGTVYQLTNSPDGSWSETILYNFGAGGDDGRNPHGRLVFDAQGNLYGSTAFGGGSNACTFGCGTIFRVSPNPDGTWSETIIHGFSSGIDGSGGASPLVLGMSGELYGLTSNGGTYNFGTVFSLTQGDDGNWTKSTIYSFAGGRDGKNPQSALTMDPAGNLYGTATDGGTAAGGTAFELSPHSDGTWTGTLLHTFMGGIDGIQPASALLLDTAGDLFGTTFEGGKSGDGVFFRLRKRPGTGWSETVLHSFGGFHDGSQPYGDLAVDASGALCGTTLLGPLDDYNGTAYELVPKSGGGVSFRTFSFNGSDGSQPGAGVIADAAGNLYGTTAGGGTSSGGTVFEITP